MWIAENWKDYEVIDCSKGEKLERWGKYLLVRPDPQVIWDTPKTEKGWRKMNGHYHRSAKGGGEWEFFDLPEQWQIHYGSLTFNLKPFSFKHTGLFPQLGLVFRKDQKSRQTGQSIKPFCLHRRCNPRCCRSRSFCHTCGRLKRYGNLG